MIALVPVAAALASIDEAQSSGFWRCIVERSNMSNNDETVSHLDHEVAPEDFRRGGPRLVFCRPVLAAEVEAGLDTAYEGDRYDEDAPKLTRTFDGLYRFVRDVAHRLRAWRDEAKTITNVVVDIVAYSYYDCMSGGMDRTCALACRAIVRQYDLDLGTPVYPGREGSGRGVDEGERVDGWYTLGDWMRATERPGADDAFAAEVEAMLAPLIERLPPAAKALPEHQERSEQEWRVWAERNRRDGGAP